MILVRALAAVRAGLITAAYSFLLSSLPVYAGVPPISSFWNLLMVDACERALWDLDYLKRVSHEEPTVAPTISVSGGEAMPNMEQMLRTEAGDFLQKSLAPFEKSRTLRPPTHLSLNLVYSLVPPSDLSQFGFDRWQREFWVYLPPVARAASWQAFAVEYGRILFRNNLRLINPEFDQWENELLEIGMTLPPRERRKVELLLKQLNKPLPDTTAIDFGPLTDHDRLRRLAQYPWHRLVRDYEVAFGLLFAAMSSHYLPNLGNLADTSFFQREIFAPNMDEEEPWRLGLVASHPVLVSPSQGEINKTMYNFSTGLRPSVRWIWINVLQGAQPEAQVAFMEKLFRAFSQQIAQRRQRELNELRFEARLNFFVLDSLDRR